MAKKKAPDDDDFLDFADDTTPIKKKIGNLSGEISSFMNIVDLPLSDLEMKGDMLDSTIIKYDFEKDIVQIKQESRDTLESLANLYISEDIKLDKNVHNIIEQHSEMMANLNFSISCAKMALVSCMSHIVDGKSKDPIMFQTVTMFQKEMRDTIKQAFELQSKMKTFYKDLKNEMAEINVGDEDDNEDDAQETENSGNDTYTIFSDPRSMNDVVAKMMLEITNNNDDLNKK